VLLINARPMSLTYMPPGASCSTPQASGSVLHGGCITFVRITIFWKQIRLHISIHTEFTGAWPAMQWLPWQATTVPQKHEAHFFQEPLAHSAAPLWKHIRKYVRIYAAVACASVESTFVYIHIHIYIYLYIQITRERERCRICH
jgi:hypothetical protein